MSEPCPQGEAKGMERGMTDGRMRLVSVPVADPPQGSEKGDLVFPEGEIMPIGPMLDVQLDCVGKEFSRRCLARSWIPVHCVTG